MMKKYEKEWLLGESRKNSEKEWKSTKITGKEKKMKGRFWTGFEARFGVSLKNNRARIGAMLFCCKFSKKLHI